MPPWQTSNKISFGSRCDPSEIQDDIDKLAYEIAVVVNNLHSTGIDRNGDAGGISLHENALLLVKATLSRNQDADLTEVLSEISKMELSLEATMQVTARVSSLNLMDYL